MPSGHVLPGQRHQGKEWSVPRGRHGQPRKTIFAIQRDRIIEAFVGVVGEHGFRQAKVTDICADAGVSTREFYEVFKNKDDCFCAAFEIGASVLFDVGGDAYDAADGLWEDRLRSALSAMLSLLSENPPFTRLSLLEFESVGPRGVECLYSIISNCREKFRAYELPARPPELADDSYYLNVLIGSVLRPVIEYVRSGKVAQLPELVPILTYSIALPVVGQSRALRQLETFDVDGPPMWDSGALSKDSADADLV